MANDDEPKTQLEVDKGGPNQPPRTRISAGDNNEEDDSFNQDYPPGCIPYRLDRFSARDTELHIFEEQVGIYSALYSGKPAGQFAHTIVGMTGKIREWLHELDLLVGACSRDAHTECLAAIKERKIRYGALLERFTDRYG